DAASTPGRYGVSQTVSGVEIPKIFADASSTTELLVASHALEYRAPIPYRTGPIAVDLVISEVGRASVTSGYVICEPDVSQAHAPAESVIGFIDPAKRRPRRLADDETAAMESVSSLPVPLRRSRRLRSSRSHTRWPLPICRHLPPWPT